MTYNKLLMVLLIGTVFLFAACQQPQQEQTTPAKQTQDITVNGEIITPQQINDVREQLSQFSGENITTEQATQYLIEEALITQEAKRRGIEPTREEVEAEMRRQLSAQNMTLEQFKERMTGEEYEQVIEQQTQQVVLLRLQEELVSEPTEEEITATYEENKELFQQQNISEEQARQEIILFITQQQGQQALQELLQELLANATIE